MLASLYCNSQKAAIESSQISTYLNVNIKVGIWENPMLLQVFRQLNYCMTLKKSHFPSGCF